MRFPAQLLIRPLLLLFALLAWPAYGARPVFPAVHALPEGQALRLPADFGAHPDFRTEWWYATGWLQGADGKPLGYQVTFFRSATEHDRANPSAFAPQQLIVAHVALSDPALGKLQHDQKSAREGFGLAYAKTGNTDVRLDGWSMVRDVDGSYRVDVAAREFRLQLRLTPSQPVLLQGERGYSQKGPHPAQASYYYSQPHLLTTGTLSRKGAAAQALSGTTWLDHEWSSQVLDANASGWDWLGANLDDGGALMAFQIRSVTGDKLWAHATWRDASGKVTQYAPGEVSFVPQAHWRSPRTNASYPVATTITTGSTVWQIKPLQVDQELDSRQSTGAVYWEGAVTVGRDGVPAGRAYLELTGYVQPLTL
jgi:predicted secreted hydrolase